MPKQTARLLILPSLVMVFIPFSLRSQIPIGGGIPSHGTWGDTRTVGKVTWNVFGKITDFKGEPLRAAAVHVDIGMGAKFSKDLTTNAQGEFRTEYTLDMSTNSRLSVNLLVSREGFAPAHEFVDYGAGEKTWEIDVAMRPDTVGDDQLTVPALVSTLAPTLRTSLESDAAIGAAKKDLARGASEFLDQHDAEKAVPNLTKVVKRYPACGNCRTLLGLALLDAGSWNGASREFGEAAKLAAGSSNPDKIDSFLVLAEIENWKGEYNKAAGFLMQATQLDPKNAFVLQELGRTLVLQQNWEAADDYLHRAQVAGASKDATLLRARALLEEGDTEAADGMMKDYVGDAGLKTFPMPVRVLASEIDERMKLRTYGKAASVVSEPLPSLIKTVPELRDLRPASSQAGETGQADLAAILQKTGENVRSFFTGFQNTVSTEQIHQERLAKDGKIKDSVDQRFHYLLLARSESWGLGLQEFRTDVRGQQTTPTGLDSGLMLTSGFASASLHFHPSYQSGATFRYLGTQSVKGRDCYVVAFAQKPEKAQMVERFNSNGEAVLVLHQGVAWIDKETYKITRLRTDLLKPQSQIRLLRETTEITYDPVDFKQAGQVAWLPSQVDVTVQWWGRTFRNVHTYSDFKLFNTEVKDTIHQVPTPEPQ
ncbi:MAG TPA: hypothetical protein VKM93_22335 [Terriglobia bacterium]|nr:hypothetical protein [Terriglobia bacterium]